MLVGDRDRGGHRSFFVAAEVDEVALGTYFRPCGAGRSSSTRFHVVSAATVENPFSTSLAGSRPVRRLAVTTSMWASSMGFAAAAVAPVTHHELLIVRSLNGTTGRLRPESRRAEFSQ
jgi:hypothetical protein